MRRRRKWASREIPAPRKEVRIPRRPRAPRELPETNVADDLRTNIPPVLFVEHGLAPDLRVRKWQHRLTPAWSAFSGGWQLDRPIERLVADAGFKIDRMQSGYMPGPRIMTFMYEGCA